MLSVPTESFEEGTVVFVTTETTWFVVGPLAFAGENDCVAAESEIAGWAAEMFSGNHAVEKTGDMSDLAYATTDSETTDGWPFDDHGSCVCWFLHEGCCCSRSRVRSVVSSVRAFQMLAAYAFPFRFQYLLAAMHAVMLMGSFCSLRTGFERVRVFELLLCLDPGFFEHVAHVWKGKLAKDESEETFSLWSSGATDFQVPLCGILAGFSFAPGKREFWKERHWSIIDNDVRDAVVENPEYQFEAAAALGTCRSQPEKVEAANVQSGQNIQFFIKGVRGAQTQVVRGGSRGALGLVLDVHAMIGGRIVDHSLPLESPRITSNCTVSFFSRLRGGSRENVLKLLRGALLAGENEMIPVW